MPASPCAHVRKGGWTGFYPEQLWLEEDGKTDAHTIIADYGKERSNLLEMKYPDDTTHAAGTGAWCAKPGSGPDNWGARAYVLKPTTTCPAKHRHGNWQGHQGGNGDHGKPIHEPPFQNSLPGEFAQFKLMDKTISFTVDLHRVGCGAVFTLYLAGLPGLSSRYLITALIAHVIPRQSHTPDPQPHHHLRFDLSFHHSTPQVDPQHTHPHRLLHTQPPY